MCQIKPLPTKVFDKVRGVGQGAFNIELFDSGGNGISLFDTVITPASG
jgi:hypothetical protein